MASGEFKRALGLVDATAVVVGSMIGSGIFIVSAETSRHLGSPGWMLVSWILSAVMTVVAAVCYSELASMYPHAGGQYVFLRQAYGRLAGFLYGWTLFAVIQTGTIAAVGVAFAKFLGVFVPAVSNKNILMQAGPWMMPMLGEVGPWKFTTLQVVAMIVIAVLTAINCGGIRMAKLIQTSFTITKASALFLLIVLGALAFDKHHGLAAGNFSNFWEMPHSLEGTPLIGVGLMTALSISLVGPLFASDAWNNVTFTGEEVKDAEKVLPRSLALGTFITCLLYILTNIVYLLLLPMHGVKAGDSVIARGIQFAAEDRVGTAAAQIIFGPVGEQIMAVAIMISTFGALNGLILAGPRAYYAMAKDGLFFKNAGLLNVNTNVPVFGLVLQAIWSCILATSGTYGNLLEFVIFNALAFYVLTVGAIFVLRKNEPNAPRPFKVPLFPILPILYLVTAIAIMIGVIISSPGYSGFGLMITLSGIPAYWIWSNKFKQGAGAQVESESNTEPSDKSG